MSSCLVTAGLHLAILAMWGLIQSVESRLDHGQISPVAGLPKHALKTQLLVLKPQTPAIQTNMGGVLRVVEVRFGLCHDIGHD